MYHLPSSRDSSPHNSIVPRLILLVRVPSFLGPDKPHPLNLFLLSAFVVHLEQDAVDYHCQDKDSYSFVSNSILDVSAYLSVTSDEIIKVVDKEKSGRKGTW
jgi:hypothetical protein